MMANAVSTAFSLSFASAINLINSTVSDFILYSFPEALFASD